MWEGKPFRITPRPIRRCLRRQGELADNVRLVEMDKLTITDETFAAKLRRC
jgi:hypothetical protein